MMNSIAQIDAKHKVALALYFSNFGHAYLSEVRFIHPFLDGERRSIRGKSAGAYRGYCSFQWTAGVQALSIFFLLSILAKKSRDQQGAVMSGEGSSLAASLDNVLSKQPVWLLDMFGIDRRGTSLARRFILRTNPERKRGPVVAMTLNEKVLPYDAITVFLNGHEITLSSDLANLVDKLTLAFYVETKAGAVGSARTLMDGPGSGQPKEEDWPAFLRRIFIEETQQALLCTSIFSRLQLNNVLAKLNSNPIFQRIAGRKKLLLLETEMGVSTGGRLGLAGTEFTTRQLLAGEEMLTIAVDATSVPSMLIFEYLRRVKGYNIRIDYNYADTTEMVKHLTDGTFGQAIDGFLLSAAAVASFLNRSKRCSFNPLMLFPSVSHRVVAHRRSRASLNSGRFMFMTDIPGSCYFYFHNLIRSGAIDGSATEVTHMDPDEVLPLLSANDDNDSKSVLFFPHYHLNKRLNGCLFLDNSSQDASLIEHVFLLHDRLCRNRKFALALDIAIRDAWLSLRETKTLNNLIDQLLGDSEYLTAFERCCGLCNIHLNEALNS